MLLSRVLGSPNPVNYLSLIIIWKVNMAAIKCSGLIASGMQSNLGPLLISRFLKNQLIVWFVWLSER